MPAPTPPYYETMASGGKCIVLESHISYHSFPDAAERWARTLGLTILERGDGVSERVWTCVTEGYEFWLSYDDWFPTISLEPRNAASATMIPALGASIGAS